MRVSPFFRCGFKTVVLLLSLLSTGAASVVLTYGGGGSWPSSNATSAFSTCTSALAGEREGLCRLQRSEQNFAAFVAAVVDDESCCCCWGFLVGAAAAVFRRELMTRPQVWQ